MKSRNWIGMIVISLFLSRNASADDVKPPAPNPELATADHLYRSGNFAAAAQKYAAILETQPHLVPAQAGLVRSLLRQQKVDEAFTTAGSALAAQPTSSPLLAAMADVEFRRAEMPDAEANDLKALKLDPRQVPAYLGFYRLYEAFCYYRRAYEALNMAHQIAPDNPEVQKLWFARLPSRERIVAMEAYLAGEHPDDPEQTEHMQQYLQYLKATNDRPVHACRLVSKVDSTDIKLEEPPSGGRHSYDLAVKLNNRNSRLVLDTGASGIVVSSRAAEKSGLPRIADIRVAGIGDRGSQGGYTAVADHIRVGELEFEDCVVQVAEKMPMPDEDGLIGADVFSSYLIDIDMPGRKLRLSPLPKRPDEAVAPTALSSQGESRSSVENGDNKEASPSGQPASGSQPPRLPKDRYIAPEMASWLQIFRFGHELLIPTRVNDSKPMLFLIDTGAFDNILSTTAAQRVSNLLADTRGVNVRGLSGSVDKVYRAKAKVQFGHFANSDLYMLTLDMSRISRITGTEVSGVLGFAMLSAMHLKIDYRDGLVDFTYNPKH